MTEAGLVRRVGRQPRAIDREWLYEQYVIQLRTLPDIAAGIGMSTMNLNRRAKQLGIPLRPRGGASHAVALRRV